MSNLKHQPILKAHPDVAMDDCHIDLVAALILAHKPWHVLEIGIGSGALTSAMLNALDANGCGVLTSVDGFNDWGFVKPEGMDELLKRNRFDFILRDEYDFIKSCENEYDLVVSDADHAHTGDWWEQTLDLVVPGGLLIYHDSTSPHCPSVTHAVESCRKSGCSVMTFNKSSLLTERCERGISIIQKNQ